MTAKSDAENFERGITGDARQQRRRLDAVTSAAVMEDDFLRLGRIQRQIVLGRPRRYVVQFDGACVDAVGRDDEICVVCELNVLTMISALRRSNSADVTPVRVDLAAYCCAKSTDFQSSQLAQDFSSTDRLSPATHTAVPSGGKTPRTPLFCQY